MQGPFALPQQSYKSKPVSDSRLTAPYFILFSYTKTVVTFTFSSEIHKRSARVTAKLLKYSEDDIGNR